MGIRVWWIGEGPVDEESMEHARAHLQQSFGEPAALAVRPGAPADAFDRARGQHLSGRLLAWLAGEEGEGRVVGVTDRDLFIPILTFVFGEAQLGGRAAVVSTHRLRPDPRLPRPRELFHARLAKECAHELGHAYGLRHCDTPRCVMGRSSSVPNVDSKSAALCADCRTLLNDLRSRGSQAP